MRGRRAEEHNRVWARYIERMEPCDPHPLSTAEFTKQLRKRKTAAEMALWDIVKRPEFRNWRWRQQMPLESYVLDIAAPSIKLAVEADGESHANKRPHDEYRDRELEGMGWKVMRFSNEEILVDAERVASVLFDACEGRARFRY